jgi:hypothetical protein
VPDAEKVTGLPVRPVAVPVTVLLLVPAVPPTVQLVSVATPAPFVLIVAGLAGLVLPAPAVRVNVTAMPETSLLFASVTLTDGGAATAVLVVAVWLVTELATMIAAGPAVPEARNVTGLPVRPVTAAVTVLLSLPAVGPRVQLVSVATPAELVFTVAGLAGMMVPPPAVRVKVTATPDFGLPLASVTSADGGAPTAAPAVAL